MNIDNRLNFAGHINKRICGGKSEKLLSAFFQLNIKHYVIMMSK